MAAQTKKKFKDTKVGKVLGKIGSIFKVPAAKKVASQPASVGGLSKSISAPNLSNVVNSVKNAVSKASSTIKSTSVPTIGGKTSGGQTLIPKSGSKPKSGSSGGGQTLIPIAKSTDYPMSYIPGTVGGMSFVPPKSGSGQSRIPDGQNLQIPISDNTDLTTPTYTNPQGLLGNESNYNPTQNITIGDLTGNPPGLPKSNITNTDYQSIIDGLQAGTVSQSDIAKYEQDALTKEENQYEKILRKLEKERPDNAQIYQDALDESGKLEAQKLVNDKQAQLAMITAKAKANQLATIGQGRGIPEAILGGQQAEFARQAAIEALPVSAELAAAQGNLEMATENLNLLYKIRSEQAANEFSFKMKVADFSMQFATKKQAAKISAIKDAYKEQQDLTQRNLAELTDLAYKLLAKGKSISFLNKIDLKSPNAVFSALSLVGGMLADTKSGSGSSSKYTVENGDTDIEIARKKGLTVDALRALNPGVNWYNLQIGQQLNTDTSKLKLPEETQFVTLTPSQKTDAIQFLTSNNAPQDIINLVKSGDEAAILKTLELMDNNN